MIGNTGDLTLESLALPRPAAGQAAKELGQEDFLTLMLTQFQNQSPLEPMESGDFLGQMAQFSTVSGIGEISRSVAALSEALWASQAMQASTMIGRTVLVSSNEAVLEASGAVRGAIELPAGANGATVRISDASGQLVRELDVSGTGGTLAHYAWDGVTSTGEIAPPGAYRIEAVTKNGIADLGVPSFTEVGVVSVALDPNGSGSLLTTEDGRQLRFSQVRAVM